jgi:DNA-directed RNA polymerase specialized sigma54-like protein
MSVKEIIQHSLEKNPLAMKEALEAEMQARVRLALEAKINDMEDDEDDEDDDEDDEDDEDEDEDDEDDDMDESLRKTAEHKIKNRAIGMTLAANKGDGGQLG